MTIQTNLDLIWASTGGVTDPGDIKYQTGWISEIPTYQNFNFVLQNHAKNLLVAAEQGYYEWQAEISYKAGVEVREAGKKYFCIADHTNQQPSLDTTNNYWIPGNVLGDAVATAGDAALGVLLKDAGKQVAGLWSGNDLTIESIQPLISMASNGAGKNWLVGNVSGEMVMVDVGVTGAPDGRNIALGQAGVYRVYHEGHKPTQAEVSDTLPLEPQDGKLYARRTGNWEEVNSTTVSTAPPPPVLGTGQGWFNLDDGQYYIDIDDGDSSQWVRANPPVIPQVDAVEVDFDSSNVVGSASTVQGELELLDSLIERKNILVNGRLDIWQRGTSLSGAGYLADRWVTAQDGGWTVETSRQNVGNSMNLTGMKYYARLNASVQGSGAVNFGQKIDQNLTALSNKYVTLSYWLWNASGKQITNTPTAYPINTSPVTIAASDSVVIPSTPGWVKYTHTLLLPDLNEVTLQSNSYYWLQVLRFTETVDVYITGIQLELGTEATPFENRNEAEELAFCQRYYEISTPLGGALPSSGTSDGIETVCHGLNSTGAVLQHTVNFTTRKRTIPSVSLWSSNAVAGKITPVLQNATFGTDVTQTAGQVGTRSFRVTNTTSGNAGMRFHWAADAEL